MSGSAEESALRAILEGDHSALNEVLSDFHESELAELERHAETLRVACLDSRVSRFGARFGVGGA